MLDIKNKQNASYKIWQKILTNQISLDTIIKELTTAKLQTRSGFSFVSSLTKINRNDTKSKYIICNAEEGEPGTFKDRDLLLNNIEELIEGIAVAGFIIRATVGYIYIRWEFKEQFNKIENAIKQAYNNKLLGTNIIDSKIDFDLYVLHGAGGYIAGEFTAMIESIEGKKSLPRVKPPLPDTFGLYGCPTAVINVETLVNISIILNNGALWYLNQSKTEMGGGTKIFSISGHVTNPGNYEVPLGTKFIDLLSMAGGIPYNKGIKAVLPGGLSAPVLPGELMLNLALDYSTLINHGSTLGSGGIIVMDETTCMVEVLTIITKFYMEESCGQCVPCREGTKWIYKIVSRILKGQGTIKDLTKLTHIADNILGKNICALGDLASASVNSFIKFFHHEFHNKITG